MTEFHQPISAYARQLLVQGYTVIDGLVPPTVVAMARKRVLDNLDLLKNTRPAAFSGHRAGFHRHRQFEPLHALVADVPLVGEILRRASGASALRAIGLTDITVNRSQPWHVDLLRGPYRKHLSDDICWGPEGGGAYKVLLYLQPGSTLRVIPGAHLRPIDLDDDRKAEPQPDEQVSAIAVLSGSLVLMDLRLPHRGSSEEELDSRASVDHPKILISTVLVSDRSPLGDAMERGNRDRLRDWDRRHRDSPCPRMHHPAGLSK